MSKRTYVLGLIIALLLLLALRLPFLRCGPLGADVIKHYDEANYVWLANSLANGDTEADTRWAWTRAPATAFVLLVFMRLRDLPAELVICEYQIVQAFLWAGMLLVLAAITAALFDRRTALISALLLAVFPLAAFVSLIVYSETIFCAGLLVAIAALFWNSRRPHWGWLVLAGVAAGIGALARSTMLPLLPVLAVWAMAERWTTDGGPRTTRQSPISHLRAPVLAGALFLACCALTIAPWTLRNYLAHGGLIIIDTTAAYNLWASNKATGITVSSTMWAVSDNPVERQRYALRRAREDIASDPGRFARRVVQRMAEAWRPMEFDSAWGRWFKIFQKTRTRESALLAHLTTSLSVVLPLAFLGILFAPHTAAGARGYRAASLALAFGYTCIVGVTFFMDRFRLPFLLLLLPYAAWCLAHPGALFASLRRPAGLAALAVTVAIGAHYAHYVWPEQWHTARALALHGRGLLRAQWGDPAGALADQRAAATLQPRLQEAFIAAAELAAQQGDLAAAEQVLRAAAEPEGGEPTPDAIVPLQRVLLQQGRAAEAAALDEVLTIPGRSRAERLAWRTGPPPGPKIDLGEDDFGLVQGFYTREGGEDGFFRWSRPEARVLLAGSGAEWYICLRLNPARPDDLPAPPVELSAATPDGSRVRLGTIYPPRQGWTWGCVPAPGDSDGQPLEIQLRTEAFNPHVYSGNRDTRNLGVVVDHVALRDGPLPVDPATGLLFDHRPAAAPGDAALTLLGLNGALAGQPGDTLALTLWWRGSAPPPAGAYTFLHLLDTAGNKVAEYNAPLAGGQLPAPWVASEPLDDHVALPLPADLAPGTYHLVAGAFDPASSAVLARADLGAVVVRR